MLDQILRKVPTAIYMTDAEGRITSFNEAAVRLWGEPAKIGESWFCGSCRLFWPNGTALSYDESPMAIALKEGRAIEGAEAMLERPDGTRVPFLAYPAPILDANGKVEGAVNVLVDIGSRKETEIASRRLAAIIESSDDAILAKDLNGTITSWNRGAERLFGYTEEEAIGRSVTMLIPADRQNEEPEIIGRIRRGERIDHYETIRQRKDGSLVDISLSVSPVIDRNGRIVGASKIARDITERRQSEEQKDLLMREMNHRVKNLFALSSGLVSLSAADAQTVEGLAESLRSRFISLAKAHSLTLRDLSHSPADERPSTTLAALIHGVTEAFLGNSAASAARVQITGPEIPVSGPAVSSLALVLHEFATNSAKYGSLASATGIIRIRLTQVGERLAIVWEEPGARQPEQGEKEGFGSRLARTTIRGALGGEFTRDFTPEGLEIRMTLLTERLGG